MPSCLGIYTDRNIIKYAKMTSTNDKVSSQYSLDAYGLKFYDNIQTTVEEIVKELECESEPISLTLSNENYYVTQVFSSLKKKDMLDLVKAEYSQKKGGTSDAVSDYRLKLAKNNTDLEKTLAMLVISSKGELANIGTNYASYRIGSVSPLPVSIKNLFDNQGVDEECAVINIEDKTTITLFHRNEIQLLDSIPLGTSEIINKLAEKYNSTAKAYEACKRVSAYLEDSYDMDDETRDILDVIIPVLYDIRQRAEDILLPHIKDMKNLYISGTGAIINNIDLYFHEIFLEQECDVLKPFFISRDNSNIKDIIEVNSAIALALDGLGMVDSEVNFNSASQKAAGKANFKQTIKKLQIKERIEDAKNRVKDFWINLNSPFGAKRKRTKRRRISFDDGVVTSNQKVTESDQEIEMIPGFGKIDVAIRVVAIFSLTIFTVYAVSSHAIANRLAYKNNETLSEISIANASIEKAKEVELHNMLTLEIN